MTKDEIAIERLKSFEPPEGYFVAFSGGKDSIVLLDLVKRSGVKYDAHFNFTSVDPPEVLKFIREHYPDVSIDHPETTMWKLIVKQGVPPTRLMRYCCKELKERGGDGRFVLTGIRWAESNKRAQRRMNETCYKDKHKNYLHPVIDWSDADVWHYIKSRKMPYPCLYDEGFTRIGCIGCPMGDHKGMTRGFNRWPKFRAAYLRAFEQMLERRIELGKKPFGKGDTAQGVMDWWIAPRKTAKQKREESCEILMFEDQ